MKETRLSGADSNSHRARTMRWKTPTLLTLCILFFTTLRPPPLRAESGQPKKVLILHSFPKAYDFDALEPLKLSVRSSISVPVNFYVADHHCRLACPEWGPGGGPRWWRRRAHHEAGISTSQYIEPVLWQRRPSGRRFSMGHAAADSIPVSPVHQEQEKAMMEEKLKQLDQELPPKR
jgi:hypothetical protein